MGLDLMATLARRIYDMATALGVTIYRDGSVLSCSDSKGILDLGQGITLPHISAASGKITKTSVYLVVKVSPDLTLLLEGSEHSLVLKVCDTAGLSKLSVSVLKNRAVATFSRVGEKWVKVV